MRIVIFLFLSVVVVIIYNIISWINFYFFFIRLFWFGL